VKEEIVTAEAEEKFKTDRNSTKDCECYDLSFDSPEK
jgi:hypothetical protein